MRLVLPLFLLLHRAGFSQQDTVQQCLREVVISHTVMKVHIPEQELVTAEDIQRLQPVDLGDVLKKFSGTTLKSYGGLGGLKTISMRSLGANHTRIMVDGFALENAQTGQINLGQLDVNTVERVVGSVHALHDFNLPASALIYGSTFLIESFENSFSADTIGVRAGVRYGSFNHFEGNVAVKIQPARFLISTIASYKKADGNYPYTLNNSGDKSDFYRTNNDYREGVFGGTMGYRGKHFSFRAGYKHKEMDQGLPGAVILYNQTANERLSTFNDQLFSDVSFQKKKLTLRGFVKAGQERIRYVDPDYLNNTNSMRITYENRFLDGGISASYRLRNNQLFIATEQLISDLHVDDSLFALPLRYHNFSVAGMKGKLFHWEYHLQLGSQAVVEENRNGASAKDWFKVHPMVQISSPEFFQVKWKHELMYRSSFRMPSFNELYYNAIGNVNLRPEEANQLSYTLSLRPIQHIERSMRLKLGVFANRVKDKIIAIPTKNLFVWSMQNVGIVDIFGGEVSAAISWHFSPIWELQANANYTFQRAIDHSEVGSPTYGHQVAYTPIHTSNIDLSLLRKNTGVRFSGYALSYRYALNENIPSNEVPGFFVADASVFHRFQLSGAHKIMLLVSVKNMLNQSYAYIRSFVMPGRNFMLSIHYALH